MVTAKIRVPKVVRALVKMLQRVRDTIKSADEKLRSIGSKPQQQQPSSSPVTASSQPNPAMAERRVQMRQGRRDRRDGDVQAKDDVKRRSRSEGPTARRVAHSMDVGSGNGRRGLPGQSGGNSFEKKIDSKITASNKNQLSTLCSDQRGFADPGPSTDSDSDSDHMQWTKNPLMVRKVKKNKSEKRITNTEKNGSSCYNQLGARNTNRESWVFLAPEGDQGELNTEQTKNEGGSNPGSLKSKYQKLEEMRKRRIDIAVTSDEETTPESRISRLRQRALQGGLVNQKKPENFALTVSDHNGWTPVSDHRIAQTVMSDQGSRISRAQPSHDPGHSFSQEPLPLDWKNKLSTSSVSAAPVVTQRLVSRSPMELATQATQPQLGGRSVSIASYVQPTAGRIPGTGYTQPLQQRQQLMHQRQHNEVKQSVVKPFTNSEVADVSSSPAGRQQFYTIPEPQAGHRTFHNSSPEFQVRKLNSTVRIPSADSIYDSVTFSQQSEKTRNGVHRTDTETQQVFAQVNPPSVDKVVVRRGTAVQNTAAEELLLKGDKRHILPQFNEVVELRLKTQPHSRERPLSQGFEATKLLQSVNQQDSGVKSEDSLDELIESNIQYLEREIDRGKTKRTGISVSRSSSLPDPRRVTATVIKPSVTVSGQQQSGPLNDQQQSGLFDSQQQPGTVSVCARSKSKLHFHVPLPSTSLQPTPHILIADENQFSDSAYSAQSTAYSHYNTNKVDRKYSYDSKALSPRSNKEDLSKSDTQLNAAIVAPTYCYPMLHPDYSAGRSCISDQNLSQDKSSSRMGDRGMFSDVDYDIEVSERVKKWEKFMKKDPHLVGTDVKKPVSLSTIQERLEADSLMMPSEVRKSLRTSQLYVDSTTSAHPQLNMVNIKPANSDPTLHVFGDHNMLSRENARSGLALDSPVSYYTNPSNIYAPQLATRSYSQARSTTPVSTTGGLIMSPHELRQHMLANKNYKETVTTESQMHGSDSALDKESAVKRVSRYKDEMDELQTVKQESVRDLRRRFDERNNTACDDEPRIDTRVAKVCPSSKEDADVNWAQMILGLEDRIKDMEVWSPNMQSTQGIVSIERVQARTLQTIPFSEDPFWKEIEEMTTFDPNNLGSNQAVSSSAQGEMKSVTLEMTSPQSCTLPSQPRQQSGVSVRERLQRSKSLYTPNITPLTISVDSFSAGKSSSLERSSNTDKYNAPSALDEVLEDIRSSLERKPLSPKKKPGDSSDSHRSSPGLSWTSELIKSRSERSRAPIMADSVQVNKWDSAGTTCVGQRGEPVSVIITSTQKGPPPAGAMAAGQYHLDPLLLRQKLLSTGLVEEEQKDETFRRHAPIQHTPVTASKPVAIAPPQTIARSAILPTHQPPLPSRTFFQQHEKLSQVNDSIEELRQLAVNVEQKINVIKSLLYTADDQNLDKILVALRKFVPNTEPRSPEVRPRNMHDFYITKKSKLEDALSELERIYNSLNLKDDILTDRPQRMEYPLYRSRSSNSKSDMPTSSSSTISQNLGGIKSYSVYISQPPSSTMQAQTLSHRASSQQSAGETEKQTESEFDLISKSFQAIIDEVNRTASLVSNASSPHPQNVQPLHKVTEPHNKVIQREQDVVAKTASPDIQRRIVNITMKSQEVRSPPAVAPKPAITSSSFTSLQVKPLVTPSLTQSPVSQVTLETRPVPSPVGVGGPVKTEVATAATKRTDTRTRSRFRGKANEEDDFSTRRMRSKSSPTITVHDFLDPTSPETDQASTEKKATTKLNFQVTPVVCSDLTADSNGLARKPSSQAENVHALKCSVAELQLKPCSLFQDHEVLVDQPVSMTTASQAQVHHPSIVKPSPKPAPPLDTKTIVFPGTTDPFKNTVTTTATDVKTSASNNPNSKVNYVFSSESSTESKSTRVKRMGRGVAMMVELFSSSDEERLRKTQPLHTRSAPDLSSDLPADGVISASRNVSSMRPADVSKAMLQKNLSNNQEMNVAPQERQQSSAELNINSSDGAQHDTIPAFTSQSSPTVVFASPSPVANALSENQTMPMVQSQSAKPPVHRVKRYEASLDTSSEVGPTAVEAISSNPSTVSTNTPLAEVSLTTKVVLRERPATLSDRQSEETKAVSTDRPHSFHETLASFQFCCHHSTKLSRLRKYASEEAVIESVVTRTFRSFRLPPFASEPDLHTCLANAPSLEEVRQWKR